jgi:hypothetical protein
MPGKLGPGGVMLASSSRPHIACDFSQSAMLHPILQNAPTRQEFESCDWACDHRGWGIGDTSNTRPAIG